jgi:hypothetical protein
MPVVAAVVPPALQQLLQAAVVALDCTICKVVLAPMQAAEAVLDFLIVAVLVLQVLEIQMLV